MGSSIWEITWLVLGALYFDGKGRQEQPTPGDISTIERTG